MFIDTHAHLYSSKFKDDQSEVMKRALDAKVLLSIMPAVDSQSHDAMLELEKQYPDQLISMIGLHPVSVKENYLEELKIIENYLDQREWVAIGEIGMDLYWDKTYKKQQEEAFRIQCQWAIDRSWPICIHARESIDELLAIIDDIDNDRLTGVFHCFTGNEKQAQHAIDRGFYIGIGGVATFKNGGLDTVLQNVNKDKVVLETDAPYLAPVPRRGKRNESAYIPYIARKIAQVWSCEVEEVASITSNNAKKIFSLKRFAKPGIPWNTTF